MRSRRLERMPNLVMMTCAPGCVNPPDIPDLPPPISVPAPCSVELEVQLLHVKQQKMLAGNRSETIISFELDVSDDIQLEELHIGVNGTFNSQKWIDRLEVRVDGNLIALATLADYDGPRDPRFDALFGFKQLPGLLIPEGKHHIEVFAQLKSDQEISDVNLEPVSFTLLGFEARTEDGCEIDAPLGSVESPIKHEIVLARLDSVKSDVLEGEVPSGDNVTIGHFELSAADHRNDKGGLDKVALLQVEIELKIDNVDLDPTTLILVSAENPIESFDPSKIERDGDCWRVTFDIEPSEYFEIRAGGSEQYLVQAQKIVGQVNKALPSSLMVWIDADTILWLPGEQGDPKLGAEHTKCLVKIGNFRTDVPIPPSASPSQGGFDLFDLNGVGNGRKPHFPPFIGSPIEPIDVIFGNYGGVFGIHPNPAHFEWMREFAQYSPDYGDPDQGVIVDQVPPETEGDVQIDPEDWRKLWELIKMLWPWL